MLSIASPNPFLFLSIVTFRNILCSLFGIIRIKPFKHRITGEIKVDRNGTVKSAVVKESSNSSLNEIARKAALNTGTIFNIDPNAPVSNVGTITYTFVAQ